jgi:hypothetical protein
MNSDEPQKMTDYELMFTYTVWVNDKNNEFVSNAERILRISELRSEIEHRKNKIIPADETETSKNQ